MKKICLAPLLFLLSLNSHGSAIDSLKQLLNGNNVSDSVACAICNEIAYAYLYVDGNQSLFYSQKAYEKARGIKNDFLTMRSLGQMGNAYMQQNKNLPAIECFIKTSKYAEKLQDSIRLSAVYHNIAILYLKIKKIPLCEKYLNKSIDCTPARTSNLERGTTLILLGGIQYKNHQNKAAMKTYEKALHLLENSEEPNRSGHAYLNMGVVNSDLKKYDEAVRNFLIAYDKFTLLKDKHRQAKAIFSVAQAYLRQNMVEKALNYHEQAMRFYDYMESSEDFDMKVYMTGISEMFRRQGNLVKSNEMLDLAIKEYVRTLDNVDSLINIEREQAFADMAIKYDTERTEKANKILTLEKERERKARLVQRMYTWFGIAGAILMGGLGFLFWRSNQITKKSNRKIEAQKKQIELQRDEIQTKNHEITSSIEYAKSLQAAILPFEHTISKYLPHHFVLWMPRDIVSGDFYWFYEKDDIIYYAIADCTGHGVPGAFVSMTCHNILNQVIIDKGNSDPGEILSKVNDQVAQVFKADQSGLKAQDGMDVVIARYDRKNGLLDFAGAMNPLVVVRNQEAMELKTDKYPIGGRTPVGFPFSTRKFSVEKGDWIYMFSDGYKDQFGGEKGKKIMSRNFIKLLSTCSLMPAHEQKKYLHDFLVKWQGNFDRVDDVLVAGFEIV